MVVNPETLFISKTLFKDSFWSWIGVGTVPQEIVTFILPLKWTPDEIFKKYDLIIGPTTTNFAYKLGESEDDAVKSFFDDLFTNPVNMAGLPAISIPIGFGKNNLPIGMQIIANHFDEATIYKLASYIEREY